MSGLQVVPCAVLDAPLAPPLLIRSSSSSKSQLCTCGQSLHGQLPIEIIPAHLFTRNPSKMYKFVHRLVSRMVTRLQPARGLEHLDSVNALLPRGDVDDWWHFLFTEPRATIFSHMWTSLIHYHDLFHFHKSTSLADRYALVRAFDFCALQCGHLCGEARCLCNSLQLRVGTAGLSGGASRTDSYIWCPSSHLFAVHLVSAWAKLTMEALELCDAPSGDNLCRSSFGVLENWTDLLVLGRLSSLATNSVQIEPEKASFFEECSCPVAPTTGDCSVTKETVVLKSDLDLASDSSVSDRPRLITLIVNEVEPEDRVIVPASEYNADQWTKLSRSWQLAVNRRLDQPSTVVIDLCDDTAHPLDLDALVETVLDKCRSFCTCADTVV